MVSVATVHCKKCRIYIFSTRDYKVLNAHGVPFEDDLSTSPVDAESSKCLSVIDQTMLYLSEEPLPEFIQDAVAQSGWTKGKIVCLKCKSKLGSFNFVSGLKCECNYHTVPSVHLLHSKIDYMKQDGGQLHSGHMSFPQHSSCMSTTTTVDLLTSNQDEQSQLQLKNMKKEVASPITIRTSVQVTILTPDDVSKDTKSKKVSHDMDLDVTASYCMAASIHKRRSESQSHPNKDTFRRRRTRGLNNSFSEDTIESTCSEDVLTVKSSRFDVLDPGFSSSESEDEPKHLDDDPSIPSHLVCPVCLDLLYSPFTVKPCGHVFCEPCLRRLAHPAPTNTPCPLCREIIGLCQPCPDYAKEIRENYADLHLERCKYERQHEQQNSPLPWLRDYRISVLGRQMGSRSPYSRRWNGWQTILLLIIVQLLGLTMVLCIKWLVEHPQRIVINKENQQVKSPSSNIILQDNKRNVRVLTEEFNSQDDLEKYFNNSLGWLE